MRRLLAIEARRSAMVPMIPVLAVLLVLSPIARHLTPVALWASRSNDVQSTVQAIGPFVTGVAAWMAVRERRRDLSDLLACTPYPGLARWLATWTATSVWAVLSYAAVAGVVFTMTTGQATWGHPVVWPVLSGLSSLLACAVLGFVLGRLLPGRFTAPLAAIAAFVAMAASMQWALAGNRLGRLSPIYPSIGESPFFRLDPSLAVAQIVCYLGVGAAAGGLLALSDRNVAPTLHRWGAGAVMAGTLLVTTAGMLAYRSPVGDLGRTAQAAPPASAVAYTPVCAGSPLRVCVHPAFRAELPALEAALAPIAAPLAGTAAMPGEVAQARPGPPDTSMSSASGTDLPFGFGNFGLRGDTITPDAERIDLQTRFALALVTAGLHTKAPAPTKAAQRAVALYLLRQAGDMPEPHWLPTSTRRCRRGAAPGSPGAQSPADMVRRARRRPAIGHPQCRRPALSGAVMTLPPRRLIGLHLRARQVDRAALALAATALALRASHHWTTGSGLFPQLTLLLFTAAAATTVATSTGNPFGEIEHTASGRLPILRLTHLLILTATAVVGTALAGLNTTYAVSGAALLRNLAGFTGVALLTAALLGAHLAWAAPLGYVLYCGGELDLNISNLWTWPTQPLTDRAATTVALALLTAGLTAISLTGARDRRTERS